MSFKIPAFKLFPKSQKKVGGA